MVIFYSGFKASTVTSKKTSIKRYFANVAKAAIYTDKDIHDILLDKNIIRNKIKIKSLVKNAKQMQIIQKEFGNFRNYIISYNKQFPLSEHNLSNLKEDLQHRFTYLGPATVNHFLTDFAFPVIKPDRMVMRVLYRSHLLKNESESEYEYAIQIGRRIASLLNIPIRYVDTVLVMLGQVGEANICRKLNPRCDICDLNTICKFV
jgi:DNA-3-methyladenine glycosylase I